MIVRMFIVFMMGLGVGICIGLLVYPVPERIIEKVIDKEHE